MQIFGAQSPLERICASQVSREWRRVALGSPRLWTSIAFLSAPWNDWTSAVWPYTHARSKWTQQCVHNVFNPRPGSTNVELVGELLARSRHMPFDLVIVPPHQQQPLERFAVLLRAHSHRLSRLHVRYCNFDALGLLLRESGGAFPALRALTAGFDHHKVVVDDMPYLSRGILPLPALQQMVLGADADSSTWDWRRLNLPGVKKLSIFPRNDEHLSRVLSSCANISVLVLEMACFTHGRAGESLRTLLTRTPTIHVSKMHDNIDGFTLELFDDPQFRDLTFDYRGRMPWKLWRSAPNPCDALEQPVHLTILLRDYAYEIEVVDSAQRRRRILLDKHTVGMTPALWDFWLREQVATAATIDAAAWSYFTTGLPAPCAIAELTLVVRANPSELQSVSLAPLSALDSLRIDVIRPQMRFPRGVVTHLVRNAQLRVLSLAANATFDDAGQLSAFVDTVVHK